MHTNFDAYQMTPTRYGTAPAGADAGFLPGEARK